MKRILIEDQNRRLHEAVRLRKLGVSLEQIAAQMAEEYGAAYNPEEVWKDIDSYLKALCQK